MRAVAVAVTWVAAVLAGLTAGCEAIRTPVDYGPLVVSDSKTDFVNLASGGRGALELDGCAVLDTAGGRRTTLVFRERQVDWNPSSREILFRDYRLGPIVLADGALLSVGGRWLEPGPGGPLPPGHSWIAT